MWDSFLVGRRKGGGAEPHHLDVFALGVHGESRFLLGASALVHEGWPQPQPLMLNGASLGWAERLGARRKGKEARKL